MHNLAEAGAMAELLNQELPPYDPHDVNPPVRPHFRSQFGGLWTDLSNADALLAGKVATGAISAYEGSLVASSSNAVSSCSPKAVDVEVVDRVLEDVEDVVSGKIHRKASYWDSTGHHIETANRENTLEREAKILDMHEASEAAQQAMFSPAISRFLNIIFERPAIAFQSLGFLRGSQQGIHRDTAFVRVSSSEEFVASWIALEDIHRVPASSNTTLEATPSPTISFRARRVGPRRDIPKSAVTAKRLHAMAREANLEFTQFRPKKGRRADLGGRTDARGSAIERRGPNAQEPRHALLSGRSASDVFLQRKPSEATVGRRQLHLRRKWTYADIHSISRPRPSATAVRLGNATADTSPESARTAAAICVKSKLSEMLVARASVYPSDCKLKVCSMNFRMLPYSYCVCTTWFLAYGEMMMQPRGSQTQEIRLRRRRVVVPAAPIVPKHDDRRRIPVLEIDRSH